MKKLFLAIAILGLNLSLSAITPSEAQERLVAGNQRFVSDKLEHPNRSKESREAVVQTQRPFAVVVGCSDSRVAPEILFDQGVGDIFVVRVAGNIVGPLELESIEFGVMVLGASTILVLGHENCGAVKAVLNNEAQAFPALADVIHPAIRDVNAQSPNALEEAIKVNVNAVVDQLKKNPVISRFISENRVNIAGGYYKLGTGAVQFLTQPEPALAH